MDAETLQALQGSIAKWEAIAAGTGFDHGPENCPLCAKFFAGGCNGCPVMEHTEVPCCDATPYEDWYAVSTISFDGTDDRGRKAVKPAAFDAARSEVAFLRSLIPPESSAPSAIPEQKP